MGLLWNSGQACRSGTCRGVTGAMPLAACGTGRIGSRPLRAALPNPRKHLMPCSTDISPAGRTLVCGLARLARLFVALAIVLSVSTRGAARAQDLRVYTTVRSLTDKRPNPPVLAESLTLFHAGRVYDYMENVGEVVIFEPLENKFTILGPDYIGTTVTFAEIQQFLGKSRTEAERVLDEAKLDPSSRRLAAALRAQFSPTFKEHVRADSIKLTGESLIYDITTAPAPKDAAWEKYLDYTDWAARLNFVLHPKSLYPDARLEANNALRKARRLPLTVDLAGRLDDRELHLRAEHRYGWELQSIDRQFIDQWNTRRDAKDVKWVAFHEYQSLLVSRKTASAR